MDKVAFYGGWECCQNFWLNFYSDLVIISGPKKLKKLSGLEPLSLRDILKSLIFKK
jgi:hypothetical protein